MDKNSLKNLMKPENKKLRFNMILALTTGIILIFLGNTIFNPDHNLQMNTPLPDEDTMDETIVSSEHSEKNLEKRLEAILSQIEGAGALKVMVTSSCSAELIVAQEIKKETTTTQENAGQGDTRKIESEKSENKVVLTEDQNGRGIPLVVKEEVPKIEGIVIVAQGGDDAIVKDSLMKAAQALLNVPAHKVQVLKMK